MRAASIAAVTKHEFVRHTSKYLKFAEQKGVLVITHHNKPQLRLVPIRRKTIQDLRGLLTHIEVVGDINDPILPGYDEW